MAQSVKCLSHRHEHHNTRPKSRHGGVETGGSQGSQQVNSGSVGDLVSENKVESD